ncbi:MAG: hypothetical protein EBZ48_04895 [Proteobacteria bacterium]|nr:hypothetical protein [Pseudomonadota bacterium]
MFFRLHQAAIIEVTGPHATRYLQNRLTNDLKSLRSGSGACYAAALSAQGKIQGLFTVFALSTERYLLCCEGGAPTEVLHHVAQFKVAERVEFFDRSDQFVALCWGGATTEEVTSVFPGIPQIPSVGAFTAIAGALLSGVRGLTPQSLLCVIPQDQAEAVVAKIAAMTLELRGDALQIARARANLPSFPAELGQDLLLGEAGLSQAISWTKGCYVGQEVVAKLDALGKAPRKLVPFSLSGNHPELGEAPVTKADDSSMRAFGRVLSSVLDPIHDETVGFLVVRNDTTLLQAGLCANGLPIRLLAGEL